MQQYLDSEGLKILNQDINERREQDLNNLADTYDSTATYSVGDLVIHDYKLWKCKIAISTAEAWNESKWEQVQLQESLFGKYVRIIDAPSSDVLTDEQIEIFKGGAFVKGIYLSQYNPVFFPCDTDISGFNQYIGMVAVNRGSAYYVGGLAIYTIDKVTKKIVIRPGRLEFGSRGNVMFTRSISTEERLSGAYLAVGGKDYPSYPTDLTKPYALEQDATTGNLAWNEKINNLAPEYDATATYAVGDVCMHDGALYQCTTAIETAEAWDATHWTQVKVDDVYANLAKIADGNVPQDGVLGIQNGEIVKGNLFGKYVRLMDAPESTTLNDYQLSQILSGVFIKGTFLGLINPVFYPTWYEDNNQYIGVVFGVSSGTFLIDSYTISKSSKVISLMNYKFGIGGNVITLSNISDVNATSSMFKMKGLTLNAKTFPSYPTNQTGKSYNFVLDDGTLAWQEQLYGPSISDNTLTELTYEKISVLSLSADKTLTLKAAQTDCIPEYKALVTNSGSSAITLTFTGVGTIHTNDPNITLVAGTNSTATIPANTKVEVNIFDGDAIVYNKNAISYATNAEVEALF